MSYIIQATAEKIPAPIREMIKEKGLIHLAQNVAIPGSPMEFLFDVFAEYLDPSREYQNFQCGSCRNHVLESFKKLEPFL